MSVIPVDPEQFSKFINKSKIFDTTRQLMIGYLTNWYNDDAETFVENMRADLSTVLEHYHFRNEFVSITKNFMFCGALSVSLRKSLLNRIQTTIQK